MITCIDPDLNDAVLLLRWLYPHLKSFISECHLYGDYDKLYDLVFELQTIEINV